VDDTAFTAAMTRWLEAERALSEALIEQAKGLSDILEEALR
jgi:hypothetical protein